MEGAADDEAVLRFRSRMQEVGEKELKKTQKDLKRDVS